MVEQFKTPDGRGRKGQDDRVNMKGMKQVVYKCLKCGIETVTWEHLVQSGKVKPVCMSCGARKVRK